MKYTVKAIRCGDCGELVYSRAHHDCNFCECGNVAIDGGPHIEGDDTPNYLRIIGSNLKTINHSIEFDGSLKEFKRALFDDWSLKTDKLGRASGVN
jgi:hypothetical protein